MSVKGSWSRVKDLSSYRDCPLWENMKNKTYNSYTEFSNEISPIIEECIESSEEIKRDEYKPIRFLLLDDMRNPEHCYLFDENKTLQQFSGIANFKWDVVRSYDEFVEYVEKYGIPQVVSFDNDLVDTCDDSISQEELIELYSMMNWKSSKYKTGAHCADWLVERCKEAQHPLPKYYVHSANKEARPIIRAIFETARPLVKH
jgi:hypothetical protein